MIMKAGKEKICKANVLVQVGRPEAAVEPERANVPVQFLRSGRRNYLLLGGGQPFVLFKSSTDWVSSIHIMEGNLLFSVYQFKCQSHPKNSLTETSRIMFDQISGHLRAQSS